MLTDLEYEASDEASETELLDQSLSLWRGFGNVSRQDFLPIAIDVYTACSVGQFDCVREVIKRGEVELNRKNRGGWTPLMYAAYIGHDNIISLLMDSHVDINIKNFKGQTSLMLAASCGNESVCYALLKNGGDLEATDKKGWTALYHATYSGHQNIVSFLLDNDIQPANMEAREPTNGLTPFIEAAAAGHEIIVQIFLQHRVNVYAKTYAGDTARSLALINGHIKIVSLIDSFLIGHAYALRSEAGLRQDDLSSSDEAYQFPKQPNQRSAKSRQKNSCSIFEGPQAISNIMKVKNATNLGPNPTDGAGDARPCLRDMTSPIHPSDHILSSSGDIDSLEGEDGASAFIETNAVTMKHSSSGSSSGGLAAALLGSNTEGALSKQTSNEEPGVAAGAPLVAKVQPQQHDTNRLTSESIERPKTLAPLVLQDQRDESSAPYKDLPSLLKSLGLSKYMTVFEDQDVDLQVFLSLTDNDLKEVGIKLFGPRRKMNLAIARWHSNARPGGKGLEQAYSDKLEAEMQELAIELHKANRQVEQLQAAVQQERELRSVTEGVLMEDRHAWQVVGQLASDTQTLCSQVQYQIHLLRQITDEISNNILPGSGHPDAEANSLVTAIQEGLSLVSQPANQFKGLPISELLGKSRSCNLDVLRMLNCAAQNLEKLIIKNTERQNMNPPAFT